MKYHQRNRRSTFFRVPCNEIWENQHKTPPQAASIPTHLATQRNELHHRHLGAAITPWSQNVWLEFPPSLSNWWLLFSFQHKKYTYIHIYIYTYMNNQHYISMNARILFSRLSLESRNIVTSPLPLIVETGSEFFLGCQGKKNSQVTMRSVSRTKYAILVSQQMRNTKASEEKPLFF